MVRVTEEFALSPEQLSLYQASDPLLGHLPVLIFYGASTTANYTQNSSRVQVHVFSPAGFQSFPRLTISPNSAFYGAVNHLPRESQCDEVSRGLAFGLSKYFAELPDGVKTYLRNLYPTRGRRPGSGPVLFGEKHAADLVTTMTKNENHADIIATLDEALQTQHINNLDLDLVLPPGAIVPLLPSDLEEVPDDEDGILDPTLRQYGGYTPLVKVFGEPVFLPTSRLRRAPSRPTSMNRTRSFTRDQKSELRMKLAEIVDTEERYVHKLRDLVQQISAGFRNDAKEDSSGPTSPSEEQLAKLFPESAEEILNLNTSFMEELRRTLDETEEEAQNDIKTPTVGVVAGKLATSSRSRDLSGALTMARLFLYWFPKFTNCYQEYIRASQQFPTLLNSLLGQSTSFRQRVNRTGEQTLRSLLIEPVQRLPRYSLLIDQIVTCLPITHPALQPMLRARDIITNICSMDEPLPDRPHVANRLRNMVESWPLELEPQGRLLQAADFVELLPPFQVDVNQCEETGIMLLFSDCIVILKKVCGTMTGRDLLREIDKPSAAALLASMTTAVGDPENFDFVFAGWHNLADVRFTESQNGASIWMTSSEDMKGAHGGEHRISKTVTSRCFLLLEAFEGKASKWSENIVKARVEGRFPEAEREDACWSLRTMRTQDFELSLYTAIFQEGAHEVVHGRREPAPIRIVVDHEKGTKGAPVGHYGIDIVVNITLQDSERVSMVIVGLGGKQFQDEVTVEDFVPTMLQRVTQLLSIRYDVSNKEVTAPKTSFYSKILRNLVLSSTRAEKTRSFLTSSPVKLLSGLWGGGGSTSNRTPEINISEPRAKRQTPTVQRSNSMHSIFGSLRSKDVEKIAVDDAQPENPIIRLERTFMGYVSMLQARKGAIIGRTLLNRAMADELAVNDLYNKLIEHPFDSDISAETPVVVIFVAFEKFLRIAWTERLGPVISQSSLDALQQRANKIVPGDFADFLNFLLGDVAPQNRRAFSELITLLAVLLEGCGNDSDRGALTLAFAELLVVDESAPNYINLLDRLVDDADRLFDEPGLDRSFMASSIHESINSTMRGNKSYTGSIASNASSLRKKFGLDVLLRQGSKDEKPSVWRSLSKHRNPATGESPSLLRPTANRTRSIDDSSIVKRLQKGSGSRDRPPIAGAFDEGSRPNSSSRMDTTLETIGEPEPPTAATLKIAKHKRRSSLSDLRSLMATASLEGEPEETEPVESAPLRPLQLTKQNSEKVNSVAKMPTPSKIPTNMNLPPAQRSPRQKENIPVVANDSAPETYATKQESPQKIPRHLKTLSSSNIPTLKPSRPVTAGGGESPTRTTGSPSRPTAAHKLRLQSPQKLREKLQNEKQAASNLEASLVGELSKIGQEMAMVNQSGISSRPMQDTASLASTLASIEEKLAADIASLKVNHATLQREMDTTLKASEAKVRGIDQLYKEAMAENELLHERFNEELGKIVKALRGKGKEDKEELVMKMKEHGDETGRVKKENARLKREMASLRASIKAAEQAIQSSTPS